MIWAVIISGSVGAFLAAASIYLFEPGIETALGEWPHNDIADAARFRFMRDHGLLCTKMPMDEIDAELGLR